MFESFSFPNLSQRLSEVPFWVVLQPSPTSMGRRCQRRKLLKLHRLLLRPKLTRFLKTPPIYCI